MNKFQVGQEVVVERKEQKFLDRWEGFRAKVHALHGDNWLWLEPLSPRPDGYNKSKFMWPSSDVKPVSQVKDFLGKAISPGDTIVYPGRASSSLWLNKGKVLSVNEKTKNKYDYNSQTNIPVTYHTLTVEREGRRWVWDKATQNGDYVTKTSKVTLVCLDRVVVVNG